MRELLRSSAVAAETWDLQMRWNLVELNTHTQVSACETWMRLVDSISLGVPVLTSQFNTKTWYHWGKLGKGHRRLSCILSYNRIYLCNYLRIKGLIKNTKKKKPVNNIVDQCKDERVTWGSDCPPPDHFHARGGQTESCQVLTFPLHRYKQLEAWRSGVFCMRSPLHVKDKAPVS